MDAFLGSIQLFAFNFTPMGWAPCDGAQLPIMQNEALYALLGTTFGGNGQTNFNLPKLTSPQGTHYCIALQGIFPSRP